MKLPPLLQLHFLVVLLALTAILAKFISLPVPALVFWRTLLAAGGMALLLSLTRPALLRLPSPRQLPAILGVGAVIALHWLCFFGAITLSNVSVALSGLASISLFTAFTEAWHEKRPPHRREITLGLVVLLGLLIIIGFETRQLSGLLVALLGSFLASLFPVWNRHLVRDGTPARTLLFYEMSAACLTCAACLFCLPGELFAFRLPLGGDWPALLVLALLCTTLGHTWHTSLLRHMSAYTANLAVNFEPIYGMILAALLFHEHAHLHPGFYLGASLIIMANLAEAILAKRRKPLP
ncbi:MAG: DMT family transporter [Verrucomicrobiales bacterium]